MQDQEFQHRCEKCNGAISPEEWVKHLARDRSRATGEASFREDSGIGGFLFGLVFGMALGLGLGHL